MKKNLFLWLMLIMLGFGGMAQTEITVGNGSYSYNYYAPMHLWYKYAITQSIYLADEIGMSGYINSIAYKQTVTGATRNITVYMAETDKSQFSSSSDALSADEFTEVFSGSWTIGVGEWSEIELTTPFEYTGTGNLVIAVVDGTGSTVGSSKYWQSSTGTGRTLYQYNDNNPYTISFTGFNTPANYYPDVKLTISEGEITCHPVTNLANSGVTANSATISWTAPEDGGSYIVMCKKSNQSWEDDDVVTIDGISETEYEITGLSAATAYDVRVINDCGDNQSAARSTNFTTLCAMIADLPYVQNFDAVATDSMPACWAKLNPYTNYPRVTTNKAMSGKAMEFRANGASYAVLPEFEEDLSNLQISFYTRREGANSGSFDAGYIFNMDTATFVPVYSTTSGEIGDNDYHKIIAKFTEFESDGESVANIAFRYKNAPSFSSWYWFVDEVKVDYATDCTEPTQLSVSNIKSTSADLSWVSDADDYTVYYKKTSDTEYDMYENVTLDDNNVYTLEGLDPETKYTWYVEANCSSAVPSDTATFTTECSPISEIPYTWDFESGNTGGTTSYPLPACWKRNEANSTNYPYVYETTSTSPNETSGTHYLYFYNTGNTAIMNAIDIESFDITSLQISFNGRSAATAGSPIIVGVMTDPFNASTFDTVSVVALTNTMDSYDVIFANYEGEGTYIALRNGSSSSTYLDDLVLD
ncbi:MAG: fibronectin type III domain-containing protein, partial [Bacteroidales bacterium]|nr:fibronectin type III domain-containing protein [Bacteroidales bacterium]